MRKCEVGCKCGRHRPKTVPESIRQQISNTLLGHEVFEETRQKLKTKNEERSALGWEPWNKGRTGVYSSETIELIREGAQRASKGRFHSEVTKRGMSEVKLKEWASGNRKPTAHGSDNGNWRGHRVLDCWAGTQWRKAVFERDEYICQLCGQLGERLEADHIIPKWREIGLIYHIPNGRTLCRSCHRQTPTFGYRKENKRLKEYQLPLPLVTE